MWFMSIKLPKLNNSVSTQGKVTTSLHVCIKCVYFYKLEITFIAFELILLAPTGALVLMMVYDISTHFFRF